MPRDDHHVPKSEKTLGDHPIARTLSSWIAQFIVPALANRAAGLEMTARYWVEQTGPRRRVLQARVAAQPVSALVALGGVAYLLAVISGRSKKKYGGPGDLPALKQGWRQLKHGTEAAEPPE